MTFNQIGGHDYSVVYTIVQLTGGRSAPAKKNSFLHASTGCNRSKTPNQFSVRKFAGIGERWDWTLCTTVTGQILLINGLLLINGQFPHCQRL